MKKENNGREEELNEESVNGVQDNAVNDAPEAVDGEASEQPKKQKSEKAKKQKKAKAEGEDNKLDKTYKLPILKKPVSQIVLIRIISIFCASVVAIVALVLGLVLGLNGCGKKEYTLTFSACAHVRYECGLLADGTAQSEGAITVKRGTDVEFAVIVDDGYNQAPTVRANSTILAVENGKYTVTVNSDTAVSVENVTEVADAVAGEGTSQSPFRITSARELNYVAQIINQGVNAQYVFGYYRLDNDIDCGGAELSVIGNGFNGSGIFAGNFNGNGHTIKNYVINGGVYNYAGLFGYVSKFNNTSYTSGVNFADSGIIRNLNLDNFTLNAYAENGQNVVAGSIVGCLNMGEVVACNATNGQLNVYGNSYFCYAGGAVGIQQSVYTQGTASFEANPAVVANVSTDVNVYCGAGYMYAGGGITGHMYSDHARAVSLIMNSHSSGRVMGAMRAGGIVGNLGEYSSVANCYSTGEIEANAKVKNVSEAYYREYGAYAGGIAGYCENDSVVSDCFTTASVYAVSADKTTHNEANDVAGGITDGTHSTRSAVLQNCYSGSDAKGADEAFIRNTLGWTAVDWSVESGKLPVINTDSTDNVTFNVKLHYAGEATDGHTEQVTLVLPESAHFYLTISDYFADSNPVIEDIFSHEGLTSYGYYFDSALKNRVPYGYAVTKDVELWIGFADYTDIAKTYYLEQNGRVVTVELTKEGEYIYTDGVHHSATFNYDGENIYLYDAMFARLSKVVEDDSPNLNFNAYNFVGKITDEGLSLYDGTYFTEKSPVKFLKAKPAGDNNVFVGVWERSATINKVYEFKNDLTYTVNGGSPKSYTVREETETQGDEEIKYFVADLVGDVKARIVNGLLVLSWGDTEEYYGLKGSLIGTWFDTSSGNYVRLGGYGKELSGEAVVSIDGTAHDRLLYIRDGFFGANSLTLISADTMELFGYLNVSENDRLLTGVLYSNAMGGFTEGHSFRLVDNYSGEWIGQDETDFILLDFNGFGLYNIESGLKRNLGYLTINGERVEYTVTTENELEGEFTYKSVKYKLTFNDANGTVTVSGGSANATLQRKDELYTYTLIDNLSNRYTFNGGGELAKGGLLTITNRNGVKTSELGYRILSGTIEKGDLKVDILDGYNGNSTGSLTINSAGTKFVYSNGSTNRNLDIYRPFNGSWAISGIMQDFRIGNFDLKGKATGTFMGRSANYETVSENVLLVTFYRENDTAPSGMYIIMLDNDNLALSSYTYLVAGDYYYASRVDDLFISTTTSIYWTCSTDRNHVFGFDGLADSRYTFGVAYDYTEDVTYLYTKRFGNYYMWDVNDDTKVYRIDITYDLTHEPADNVFGNGAQMWIEFVEFDSANEPVCSATDEEGTEYKFYLDGSINVDGYNGTYQLDTIDGDTVTLVISLLGEEEVTATVDTANGKVTITG